FGNFLHLQATVHGGRRIYQETDIINLKRSKARRFGSQSVCGGQDLDELILALFVGFRGARESGRGVRNAHVCTWHHSSSGVGYRSPQRGGRSLRPAQGRE